MSAAFGERHVLRFAAGERVVEGLLEFLGEQPVGFSFISALGGVRWARLGYWDVAERRYREREFAEQMEVLSLVGDSSRKGAPPISTCTLCSDGPITRRWADMSRSVRRARRWSSGCMASGYRPSGGTTRKPVSICWTWPTTGDEPALLRRFWRQLRLAATPVFEMKSDALELQLHGLLVPEQFVPRMRFGRVR
ncbi:MAG: PCC domain-containing protein [Candidatus Dormibacteraceae bacterium]